MLGQIKQRVDLGEAHLLRGVCALYNFVASSNFPLFQYTKVKTWSVMRYHQGCHLRFVHADTDAVTGDPRLRYLESSRADPIAVTDTNFNVRQAIDGEVFAKLSVRKISA